MKKYIKLISLSIFLILFIILPYKVYAEEQTILEFKHIDFENDTIITSININTNEYEVNGVTADFTYSSDILEVVEIDTSNSLFESFAENDYSQTGLVYLSCFSTNGVKGEGEIARIKFRVVSSGKATLQFTSDTVVLESDNSTNVLSIPETQIYTVNENLDVLPQTGADSNLIAITIIVFLIAIVMLVIFTLFGFTIWGSIYLSLGKWQIRTEAQIGISDKKKKNILDIKKTAQKNIHKDKKK